MAANDLVTKRFSRSGLGILQPSAGLSALGSILANSMRPHTRTSIIAVVPFDWGVLLKVRLLGQVRNVAHIKRATLQDIKVPAVGSLIELGQPLQKNN